jgi:hypothetical protein
VGLSRGGFDVSQSIVVPPPNQLILDDFVTKDPQEPHSSSNDIFKKQKTHDTPPIYQQICSHIDVRTSQIDLDEMFFQEEIEEVVEEKEKVVEEKEEVVVELNSKSSISSQSSML